eukprot:1490758-Pyramimonas_sp.AAC.1
MTTRRGPMMERPKRSAIAEPKETSAGPPQDLLRPQRDGDHQETGPTAWRKNRNAPLPPVATEKHDGTPLTGAMCLTNCLSSPRAA